MTTLSAMSKRYKHLATGASIAFGLLSVTKRALIAALSPEPKTCPKCTYRMVEEVRSRRVLVRDEHGKRRTERHSYWLCGGCLARYKRVGEGPFLTPDEDEWARYVGEVRPKVPKSL